MSYEIDKNLKEIEGTIRTAKDPKNKSGKSKFKFKHPDLAKIQYTNPDYLLTLNVSADLEKPKLPDWLKLEKKYGEYILCFPDGYENELVFLLLEMYEDESNSGNVEPQMEQIFLKWCKLMKAKEPINVSEQKGIMGEIACILASIPKYKQRAVIGWDRSNLRDIQITDSSNNQIIHIESKAHSPSSTSITISARNQLEYLNDNPPVILGVSLIQRSLTGLTLPEYVESSTIQIRKICTNSSSVFENLDIIKSIKDRKDKFRSRFQIISTDFYRVSKTDECNQIATMKLPKGTDFATWYLALPVKISPYTF